MLITVGTPPVEVELSSRVREHCPLLRSLLPHSSLPKVHITAFRIVLSYLDGDNDVTRFMAHTHDTTLLLHFAQAWSLAAQLKLPLMQNKLVSIMTDIYNESLENEASYPADDNVLKSFRHLREECGHNSHAEKFLTSFVGRTTLSILALKTQLRNMGFDPDVRNNLVAEARSLNCDPIKYTRHRFLVDVSCPLRYEPLEIRVNLFDHALLPPHVPAARDQEEPVQRGTYQATILSPLKRIHHHSERSDRRHPRTSTIMRSNSCYKSATSSYCECRSNGTRGCSTGYISPTFPASRRSDASETSRCPCAQ
jgi:hypothetical protein